jgi:hypothetical protein
VRLATNEGKAGGEVERRDESVRDDPISTARPYGWGGGVLSRRPKSLGPRMAGLKKPVI